MIEFFVNNLFDGFILLALPLAVLAGLISFISPCVLPLVPGYLAYAAGFSQSRGRVLLGSSLFVLGFSYHCLLHRLAGSNLAENSVSHMDLWGLLTLES